jgi:hypothetical protein
MIQTFSNSMTSLSLLCLLHAGVKRPTDDQQTGATLPQLKHPCLHEAIPVTSLACSTSGLGIQNTVTSLACNTSGLGIQNTYQVDGLRVHSTSPPRHILQQGAIPSINMGMHFPTLTDWPQLCAGTLHQASFTGLSNWASSPAAKDTCLVSDPWVNGYYGAHNMADMSLCHVPAPLQLAAQYWVAQPADRS